MFYLCDILMGLVFMCWLFDVVDVVVVVVVAAVAVGVVAFAVVVVSAAVTVFVDYPIYNKYNQTNNQ